MSDERLDAIQAELAQLHEAVDGLDVVIIEETRTMLNETRGVVLGVGATARDEIAGLRADIAGLRADIVSLAESALETARNVAELSKRIMTLERRFDGWAN